MTEEEIWALIEKCKNGYTPTDEERIILEEELLKSTEAVSGTIKELDREEKEQVEIEKLKEELK